MAKSISKPHFSGSMLLLKSTSTYERFLWQVNPRTHASQILQHAKPLLQDGLIHPFGRPFQTTIDWWLQWRLELVLWEPAFLLAIMEVGTASGR
jgi:hypothetical protein